MNLPVMSGSCLEAKTMSAAAQVILTRLAGSTHGMSSGQGQGGDTTQLDDRSHRHPVAQTLFEVSSIVDSGMRSSA
jgi:hypothetical protein